MIKFEDVVAYQESRVRGVVGAYLDGDTVFITEDNGMGKKSSVSLHPTMNQVECEYCSRVGDLARSSNCQGCAAPLPLKSKEQERFDQWQPAIMYDSQMLGAPQGAYLGTPNQNIPINSTYSGLFQGAASVGASMLKGFIV